MLFRSNAAPVVAMIWGFFVWKEFKGAPKGTVPMIATMFVLFVVGLVGGNQNTAAGHDIHILCKIADETPVGSGKFTNLILPQKLLR